MSEVAVQEGAWTLPRSERTLFYRLWRPADPVAALLVVHGFGEHGGRYVDLADELAGQGLAVAIPDLWGHGRSGGARGDQASFAQYVEDLRALTVHVFLPAMGQTKCAVYGHSFGGLVAIHWALARPPELIRLVTQSPLLEVGFPIPAWKAAAARWLSRHRPTIGLSMDLDLHALSHNPEVVEAYRRDRSVHNRISARVYTETLRAADEAFARASTIQVPTLVLYGETDRVVSVEAVRRWAELLACQKRVVGFPGTHHELHHEAARGEIVRLVREWVTGTA